MREAVRHGNLLDFDNAIVATKAWNRLFAVADWAKARTKQTVPPEPKPKLRDVLRQVTERTAETARLKQRLEEWRPSVLTRDDDEFATHPATATVTTFLDAWKSKRWGLMAPALPVATQQQYGGRIGGEIKEMYSLFELRDFSVEKVEFVAAAMCVCTTRIVLDTGEVLSTSRWRYETEDGHDPVVPPDPGVWRLVMWGVDTFVTADS